MSHTDAVPAALETNFLVPGASFFVVAMLATLVSVVLVVWPLVETVVRQQWGYALGVVVFGPIGGLVWFTVGRRETASRVAAIH